MILCCKTAKNAYSILQRKLEMVYYPIQPHVTTKHICRSVMQFRHYRQCLYFGKTENTRQSIAQSIFTSRSSRNRSPKFLDVGNDDNRTLAVQTDNEKCRTAHDACIIFGSLAMNASSSIPGDSLGTISVRLHSPTSGPTSRTQ